ncbi:hypothetical protein OG539_09300 [Actinacidiphila glaucinigra]|uniref:hypothetical protein n=1 Tax=Actinacidiphila glaucinigra TaxID=235986 RepID=UPI002DD86F5C|nr:hypothetical protein [Actinacidiphila glaucinigra]WSD63432.1 hypothetical protein OIE69_33395 [Actinacidiphila glaucinigra]
MCVIDTAAKEAVVGRFLRDHPDAGRDGATHPALRGCAEVPWADLPGCPAGLPALLHALLDERAAPEAVRVLTNVLLDGVFRMGAAMPAALPFVIRLAVCPDVPVRSGLADLVAVAAELAEPVDPGDERAVRLWGSDADHPERARCRAVLAAHAALVRPMMFDDAPPA